MNRIITNLFRFILDDCVPARLRNSKTFMYPFFYLAYHGKQIETAMNFKSLVPNWTPEEYAKYYRELDTVSRRRSTDLSGPCVQKILSAISPETKTVFELGCGHGHLLKRISAVRPSLRVTGCDLKEPQEAAGFTFLEGDLFEHRLPDRAFDTVVCCHTLEHLLRPEKYVEELKRIAKKQLIIVVPCQQYYYYTLDEHVNFYPNREALTSLVGLENFSCEKVFGDWLYIGTLSEPADYARF